MSLPPALRESVAAAAIREGLADAIYSLLPSPLGTLLLVESRAGLARIAYDHVAPDVVLGQVATRLGPRVVGSDSALGGTRDALSEYLEGGRADGLDALRLDLALAASPFRRTVLETLRAEVGRGATIPYGVLAARAGRPGAARAVGSAMAGNPLPIVIPCHRVLPSTGRLGAYTGGSERKARLLALEGSLPPGAASA